MHYLFLLLAILWDLPTVAQSGLNKKEFQKYWRIESEAPNYRVTFKDDNWIK